MLLESSDGQLFLLHIDRYEFPDEELGPTKDNPADDFDRGRFLVVTVSCKISTGSWQATAPEMTTTELERLASWLESLQSGQPSGVGVYFTERDLEFTVDEARETLNVRLHRDFLPPWNKKGESLTMSFPIGEINLNEVVASMRSQLVQFPDRPPLPNPSA